MLDKYACPQPSDHSIIRQTGCPPSGSRKHSISSIFLCCAGLLFEALECFLLRSWHSRLLQHLARTAEWAYSYLLPGPTWGKYCVGDAHPLPDIPDLMQRVGKDRYISFCDIKSAYHQISPDHQWLTAFV